MVFDVRDSRDVTLDPSRKNWWKLPELPDIKPDQVEIVPTGSPWFQLLLVLFLRFILTTFFLSFLPPRRRDRQTDSAPLLSALFAAAAASASAPGHFLPSSAEISRCRPTSRRSSFANHISAQQNPDISPHLLFLSFSAPMIGLSTVTVQVAEIQGATNAFNPLCHSFHLGDARPSGKNSCGAERPV